MNFHELSSSNLEDYGVKRSEFAKKYANVTVMMPYIQVARL